MEVSAIVPQAFLDTFLNLAVDEYPENLFVCGLPDAASGALCLQHSYVELVATGRVALFLSASLDENALLICMNPSLTAPQEVYAKIKALHFD